MESKLWCVEKKLQESEMLRIICTSKSCELTDQNAQLENDLKNEKNDNSSKANAIVCLETGINYFDIQRSLHKEHINNLEKEKSAAELRLNEVMNSFNRICQKFEEKLIMVKSELSLVQGHIKQKNEENLYIDEKIKLLECNIGTLEKKKY